MESDCGWPLDHILSALETAGDAPCAVIVSTGALNPPHRGHAAVLQAAHDALVSAGFVVIGGFLSPSHDKYVRPKAAAAKVLAIPAKDRARLCALMLEETGLLWARPATWELSQPGRWPDFPEVVDALGSTLARNPRTAKRVEEGRLTVFYACGEDHWSKTICGSDFYDQHPRAGIVVVPRDGVAPAGAADPARLVFVAAPPDSRFSALSSTALRAAAAAGSDLGAFLPPATAAAYTKIVRRRYIFISLSALLRDLRSGGIPLEVLESALFFFGSKRFWIWPSNDAEVCEQNQPF